MRERGERRGWRLLAGGNEFSPPPAVCLRGRERYRREKSSLNQYQVTSLSASATKPSSDHSNHRPNRCRARCGLFGASCLHFYFAFAHSFPPSLPLLIPFLPVSVPLSLSLPSHCLPSLLLSFCVPLPPFLTSSLLPSQSPAVIYLSVLPFYVSVPLPLRSSSSL